MAKLCTREIGDRALVWPSPQIGSVLEGPEWCCSKGHGVLHLCCTDAMPGAFAGDNLSYGFAMDAGKVGYIREIKSMNEW
eukprot:scaffold99125_cov23-Prasinocladus_malaysianus.AAC.1